MGHLAAICPEKEGRSFQKAVNHFRCKNVGHFVRNCSVKEHVSELMLWHRENDWMTVGRKTFQYDETERYYPI